MLGAAAENIAELRVADEHAAGLQVLREAGDILLRRHGFAPHFNQATPPHVHTIAYGMSR